MKCLFKAAACLLSAVSALVIPDTHGAGIESIRTGDGFEVPQQGPKIVYSASTASLHFVPGSIDPNVITTLHILEVSTTDAACDGTNITLDSLVLTSEWDDHTGHGEAVLPSFGPGKSTWTITCTFRSESERIAGTHAVHVLSLQTYNLQSRVISAFTVSYTRADRPSILRYSSKYARVAATPESAISSHGSLESPLVWQTPSEEIEMERQSDGNGKGTTTPVELRLIDAGLQRHTSNSAQQVMGAISHVVQKASNKISDILKTVSKICPSHQHSDVTAMEESDSAHGTKHKETGAEMQPSSTPSVAASQDVPLLAPSHDLDGDEEINKSPFEQIDTQPVKVSLPDMVTHTGIPSKAAETRSLHTPTSTTASNPFDPPTSHGFDETRIILQTFTLTFLFLSLCGWLYLRFRDPRRRAERAARREEHRNKRLYRRAARRHAITTWFGSFRIRYHLAKIPFLTMDEKATRFSTGEEILEDSMKDDVRIVQSMQTIHDDPESGPVTTVVYEFMNTGTRRPFTRRTHSRPRSTRSMSTLPGYESEGTQPPAYEAGDEYVVTPDSSVVSTSPRISRDGTSSDLEIEEKIEIFDLEHGDVILERRRL